MGAKGEVKHNIYIDGRLGSRGLMTDPEVENNTWTPFKSHEMHTAMFINHPLGRKLERKDSHDSPR